MIDTSKKFLVAGAGKSGIGSVNLLLKTGADVSLYDGKEDLEKEALYEKLYEKKEIPSGVILGTSIGGLAVCAAVAVGFMVLWMHGIV